SRMRYGQTRLVGFSARLVAMAIAGALLLPPRTSMAANQRQARQPSRGRPALFSRRNVLVGGAALAGACLLGRYLLRVGSSPLERWVQAHGANGSLGAMQRALPPGQTLTEAEISGVLRGQFNPRRFAHLGLNVPPGQLGAAVGMLLDRGER